MIWSSVVAVVRFLLYGWLVALWQLIVLLYRALRVPRRPPHARPPVRSDCVPVDRPEFLRPDPLLYSQQQLLSRGLAVTWDNPDIVLLRNGSEVPSSELEAGTTYDVRIRVWNNSTEAPVVDMPVHLSFLDFGVGNQPIPIGSATIDVGVKGSASQPAFVTIPWTTPATPGHYCLQALLDPVDDLDRTNNLGQENTDVRLAQSPATFTFALHNNTPETRTYRFDIDGYVLPPLPSCDSAPDPGEPALARHRPDRYPVPDGFTVLISPEQPRLEPDASVTVTVTVEPPPGFVGVQPINVNARHELGFAGGVTLVTRKEA